MERYDYLYELLPNDEGIVVGTESNSGDTEPVLSPAVACGGQPPKRDLIIKYVNGVYRIWMDTFADFSINYTNKFCRFLDTRSVEDTVVIYLGAHLEADVAMDVPSVISSVISTPCKLHAVASGPSSAFETAIYCFAKTRELRKYGYLTFSRPIYIKKYYKEWEHISNSVLAKAVDLGLLTTDQVSEILTYNNTIVYTYGDMVAATSIQG